LLLLLLLQVRGNNKLVQKVHVVSGDISLSCLGLSGADRATLLHSVDFIIHCAADIRLEADMQVSSNSSSSSSGGIGSTDSGHATAAVAAANISSKQQQLQSDFRAMQRAQQQQQQQQTKHVLGTGSLIVDTMMQLSLPVSITSSLACSSTRALPKLLLSPT
jgi:hypothetical protein